MQKKTFSVSEWANVPSDTYTKQSLPVPIYNNVSPHDDTEAAVERIVSEIERMGIDVAPSYREWCDLGFALAEGLGERGRSCYHRLSNLHHDYCQQATDKQYTACLGSHGQGIIIATFFHMARNAGVALGGNNHFDNGSSPDGKMVKRLNGKNEAISEQSDGNNQKTIVPFNQNNDDEAEMVKTDDLPSFPDEVYDHLPSFLKDCVSNAVSVDDRDTILLGTLACISACFHNVRGVYDGRITYPNIYLFIVADAGMGKGALTLCGEIVKPIDRDLHEISRRQMKDYKEAMASFARSKGEDRQMPDEPPMRMLIIPANSSASAFLNILNDNDGQGLLFETEGDTLSQTLRSDYGNYSDVLRKAFHHEQVSQSRRKDREFVDVGEPCISVALAGTPEQVRRLIPDAENGLLSRFCFYNIPFRRGIRDVFATNDLSLSKNTIFRQLGERFMRDRTDFMRRGEFTFSLPPLLQAPFTEWLRRQNDECCDEIDNGMQGVIRRMGLVAFRIMMLLTIVREFGNYAPNAPRMPDGTIPLVCHDEDFHTAISIADVLIEHAKSVYRKLAVPEKRKEIYKKESKAAARRKRLFDELPDVFTKTEYNETVERINEVKNTAVNWIEMFIRSGQLRRTEQGCYVKVVSDNEQDNTICTNQNNQQP